MINTTPEEQEFLPGMLACQFLEVSEQSDKGSRDSVEVHTRDSAEISL